MSSIMFYRYENVDGHGPYCWRVVSPIPTNSTHRWPMPHGMEWKGDTVKFGFTSYRALLKWFTPRERALLKTEGWKLKKALVPVTAIVFDDSRQAAVDSKTWEVVSHV